ncbi:MAG: hypothetical protein ACLT98_14745 [Eggerthellaceae bacterium]
MSTTMRRRPAAADALSPQSLEILPETAALGRQRIRQANRTRRKPLWAHARHVEGLAEKGAVVARPSTPVAAYAPRARVHAAGRDERDVRVDGAQLAHKRLQLVNGDLVTWMPSTPARQHAGTLAQPPKQSFFSTQRP